MVKKLFGKIWTYLVYIFLYAPIVVLIVFSFNDSKLRGSWKGFTMRWYRELIGDELILQSLWTTISVAIIATLISTVVGTLAALGIHELRGARKKAILEINYLPVLNPDIVTAISLMGLFGVLGLNLGYLTMTISHIVFCLPYVILSILPKLQSMDQNMLEAALDLGATPMYALKKVVIPQIKPGIVTGALMAFTLSLDDFVVSFFNTGHGVSNLSMTVYSMARKGINPSINALSTLMFALLLILLLVINKRSEQKEKRMLYEGQ